MVMIVPIVCVMVATVSLMLMFGVSWDLAVLQGLKLDAFSHGRKYWWGRKAEMGTEPMQYHLIEIDFFTFKPVVFIERSTCISMQ